MTARSPKRAAPRRPDTRKTAARIADFAMRLLPRMLILLLAVLGTLFCVLTCYRLTVFLPRVIWTAIAFIALFTAVFSSKRSGLLMLVCLLFAGFICWRNADALFQSLLVLIDAALSPLDLMLPDAFRAMLTYHDAQAALTLSTGAVQALLFPISLLAACAVIRLHSLPLLALATLPLLLPAPFFSLAPDVMPFFCLITAFFALFIAGNARRTPLTLLRPDSAPGLRFPQDTLSTDPARLLPLAILPVVAASILLASLLLPEDGYARPRRIEALQEEILSWDIGGSGFRGNDGLTHGNLRNLTDIHFSGETALKVRLSEDRPLYLRDFAGVRYSDSGWTSAADADYARYADAFPGIAPQNLRAAAFPAYAPYTLTVQNVAAPKTSLWIPNGLLTPPDALGNAAFMQDTSLVAPNGDLPGYSIEAIPCEPRLSAIPAGGTIESAYLAAASAAMTGAESSAEAQAAARAYIEYLCSAYTALPDDTRQAADALLQKYGLVLRSPGGEIDLFSACYDLYRLLSSRCTYAYSPPHIPEGEDFVTYFLESSRAGYCVHFATAATVLLRALGVPARYAEGYIVISADFEKEPDAAGYIDIEDTHAHAWVEVFDPVQLEWVPVEMTASATGGESPAPSENERGGDNNATPTPSPTPTPTPTPVPTPTPSPNPTPDPATGELPTPSASPTYEPETTGDPEQSGSALGNVTPTPPPTGGNAGPGGEDADGAGDDSLPDDALPPDGSGEPPAPPQAPLHLPIWPFLVLAGIALLLLAAHLLRESLRRRRMRAIFRPDCNAGMLALCALAMQMLRFTGLPALLPLQTPEDYAATAEKQLPSALCERLAALLTLAQRARFSDSVCTKREREEAASFLRVLSRAVAATLPRIRRAVFYYWYPDITRKAK